ncbi:MAG: DnaB-like helicase N-terminal domain-containing protein [Pseudomonadota bacterium]|jgi:replicative DNA helicase
MNSNLKLPPHSIEAEQSLIGGLLLDNSAWDRIADIVSEADFYRDDHRRIFAHIRKLVETGRPADVVTVYESIEHANQAEQTGGLAYLGEMANAVVSTRNIRSHAQIVREKTIERQALTAIEDFQGRGNFTARAHKLSQVITSLATEAAERGLPASRKFSEIAAAPAIDFDYALPGLRTGNVGVFAGYGGVGKGFLGLALSIDVALGRGKLTGLPLLKAGKAVFVSIEDDQEALDARLQAYSRHLDGSDRAALDERLSVTSVYGLPDWQLLKSDERGALHQNVAATNAIVRAAHGARLLIIDTARKFFTFDENKSDEASFTLMICDQIARESGAAVLLVHHLSKPAGDSKDELPTIFSIRGSSALVADARWAAILATPPCKFAEDKGIAIDRKRWRVLDVGKVNHGGEPEMALFHQDERGALVAVPWPAASQRREPKATGSGKFGLRPVATGG